MPRGICLIGWTNKEGFFLISKYPANFELTEEEIMRIGSLHRMRRLDANVITLKLKDLNCVSFFSGLITAQYHIAPNFVIALLLEKEENPKDYIQTLPLGSKIVLSEFPVKRFDARTTTFRDVLSNIGQTFLKTLPALYNSLVNNEIQVNEDELSIILATEQKAATIEREYEQLKEELKNKDSMIQTLNTMIKEHTAQIRSEETLVRFKATMDSKMQIEELKAKISAQQSQVQDKEQSWKEELKMNELHQETITLLLDGKLVMQHRDIETREFLKSLVEALKPYDDDFHLDLIDRIEDYLKHIEWIPEM
jgi:DNA-directed RNA polymerase beta' subunit